MDHYVGLALAGNPAIRRTIRDPEAHRRRVPQVTSLDDRWSRSSRPRKT